MKYFKLFEQFLSKTNEAKGNYYTLEDYINDDIDKDEKSAAEQAAKEMGLGVGEIAIVTSEDDDITGLESEIGSAVMKPMKTANKSASYWYCKELNLVKYQDSSLHGYMVPVKMLDKL